jgi:hypothetical protein
MKKIFKGYNIPKPILIIAALFYSASAERAANKACRQWLLPVNGIKVFLK